MSASNIASLSTTLASAKTSQDIGVTVLKKAIDVASDSAAELLSSIPPAPTEVNLPAHLGQNVNTVA
jgi:hypothetical protein